MYNIYIYIYIHIHVDYGYIFPLPSRSLYSESGTPGDFLAPASNFALASMSA